jgi:hypothetical protein
MLYVVMLRSLKNAGTKSRTDKESLLDDFFAFLVIIYEALRGCEAVSVDRSSGVILVQLEIFPPACRHGG